MTKVTPEVEMRTDRMESACWRRSVGCDWVSLGEEGVLGDDEERRGERG